MENVSFLIEQLQGVEAWNVWQSHRRPFKGPSSRNGEKTQVKQSDRRPLKDLSSRIGEKLNNLTGALKTVHLDCRDDPKIFTHKIWSHIPWVPACLCYGGAGRCGQNQDLCQRSRRQPAKKSRWKNVRRSQRRGCFTTPASEDLVPITRHPPGASFSFHTLMRTGLSQRS